MPIFILRFSIVMVCFLMSGCLSPEKDNPISRYTLKNPVNTVQYAHQSPSILLVSLPTAMPGYQSPDMVYTLDGYELKSFVKHRWVAPPANMLQSLLLQNLQQSGCFKAVVTPPFAGTANKVLNTQLLMLQQEFNGTSSQIHLTLHMAVSNSATKQVTDKKIEVIVPATANTPYGGVMATDQAVQQSLGEITRWVCGIR